MKTKNLNAIVIAITTISCLAFTACTYESLPQDGDCSFGSFYDENWSQTPDNTGDKFDEIQDNPFISTSQEPQSTFSVDADGTAYTYMRRMIKESRIPDKNSVRIEEYLNYFTFDYPNPTDGNDIAINAEIGNCPWNTQHYLLRLGLKGKSISDSQMPAANYVFMIDVSGSMNGSDRLDLLKKGMLELVEYLNNTDRISIVTYSGQERLALESTLADDAGKQAIREVINSLVANGSTAGSKALEMAYQQATQHFIPGGNNRIIMGTDGDFNVGKVSFSELKEIVADYADKGIYLTVCGFGTGNFNDSMMEQLSNSGNGTYVYIDSEEEMLKVFNYERSHLLAVCSDTKVQITFNQDKVQQYRLIGYENRVLKTEDFDDDTKDAGEIGAGQTITALYELIPTTDWNNHISVGTFDVRYKQQLGESSIALSLDINQWSGSSSENLNFAAGVAAYGMILRNSEYKGTADINMVSNLIAQNKSFDPYGWREQLLTLIDLYASLQHNRQ